MTVLSHRVELGSPTGGAGTGQRQYTAKIWIESDDCEDTGHAILEYLIAQGFVYGVKWAFGNDANNALRLFQISPPSLVTGSAYIWTATLSYKAPKLSVATSTVSIDPTDFLPEIRTSSIGRREPVEEATYLGGLQTDWTVGIDRTITNSANTPFSPAIEADFYNKNVRVVRRTVAVIDNEANFPTRWINSVAVTLSNGFITVPIGAYELLFTGWETDREEYEGWDVVRVEFTGEIKKGGWREELLDIGFLADACGSHGGYSRPDGRGYYYDATQDPDAIAPQRNILDRSGIPVATQVILDGDGGPMGPCDEGRFYGKWGIYDEIDPRTIGFFAGIMT